MKRFLITALICISCAAAKAQSSDNGDGTFTNPVIWADCPDPDVIRVGDDFYFVSTTMHLMPGAPVMHSKDLVNWEIVSYIFDRIEETPRYSLQEGTVYGRGQWATSLRHHNGRFYAYFTPNDQPYKGYVYTTEDPREKWELHSVIPHFHDASFFFDDNGKAYMVYGTGQIRELKPDLTGVLEGGLDTKLFERDSQENNLLEGSRMIKKDGRYYLLMISWPRGGIRREVCYRADNIEGPYEKKVILETPFGGLGDGVAQGTIFDDPQGNWYGMFLHESQYLEPVMPDIEAMLASSQRNVTGEVTLELRPLCFQTVGVDSPNDLVKNKLGEYGETAKAWSSEDAKGFIKVTSTPLRAYYLAHPNEER